MLEEGGFEVVVGECAGEGGRWRDILVNKIRYDFLVKDLGWMVNEMRYG